MHQIVSKSWRVLLFLQLHRLTYQSRHSKEPRVDIDAADEKEQRKDDDTTSQDEHVLSAEGVYCCIRIRKKTVRKFAIINWKSYSAIHYFSTVNR